MDEERLSKLNRFLHTVLQGHKPINPQQKDLFLESVCAQTDPAICISRIIASKVGLPSLQAAIWSDLGATFLNGRAAALLLYLQNLEIKAIDSGRYLRQVLLSIVDPPIFWTAFHEAFLSGKLDENGRYVTPSALLTREFGTNSALIELAMPLRGCSYSSYLFLKTRPIHIAKLPPIPGSWRVSLVHPI